MNLHEKMDNCELYLPNDVALGTPCRVVREINERDREVYFRNRRIPDSVFGG